MYGFFVYFDSEFCDFGGYFGAELEAFAAQIEVFQHFGAHELVACRFVGDVLTVKYVGYMGNESSAEVETAIQARVLFVEKA